MEKNNIKDQVINAYSNNAPKRKYWALMLFNTEIELGISNTPNKWVNTRNFFFTDGTAALNAYADTQNPASQLIDAETEEELICNMEDMLVNYSDEQWLENNLYPYM